MKERMKREAIRYLGYGKNTADERTLLLIDDAFAEIEKTAGTKSICRIFDMEQEADGQIRIGNMKIESRSLSRNLKGCTKVVLFGATLGIGVDRIITRASLTDMSRAVVLQACAAAYLEEFCDQRQTALGEKLKTEGLYLRPRFSPGYGDFDISFQKPLMQMLDCAKTIGLTMTDSCMMTPTKSVTALIGASPMKVRCPVAGCEACGKTDCEYRR